MKQIKVIIIATIVTIIIMLSCACAIPATAEVSGRSEEKENEIIEVYWKGHTKNPAGFFSLEG